VRPTHHDAKLKVRRTHPTLPIKTTFSCFGNFALRISRNKTLKSII